MKTVIVDETFHEFSRRHGGDPVALGGQYVWRTGATCDKNDRWRNEPPGDEVSRLQLELEYWRLRGETLERDFNRWSGAMEGRYPPVNSRDLLTPGAGQVTGDEVDVLRFLADALKEARAEAARIDAILRPPVREDPETRRLHEEYERQLLEDEDRARDRRYEAVQAILADVNGEAQPPSGQGPPATPGRALTIDLRDVSPVQAPE